MLSQNEPQTTSPKVHNFQRLFRRKNECDEDFCRDVQGILNSEPPVRNEILITKRNKNQSIILAGQIGIGGTVLMARYFHDELRKVFPAWMLREAEQLDNQMNSYLGRELYQCCSDEELLEKYGISAIYPVNEGGIRRTLYQLGKDAGKGYEIHARCVPVNQITIEFCEYFDLDPWTLLSGECYLIVCSQTTALLHELEQQKIPSAVIGVITNQNDKIITYETTRSLVNRPQPDALLTLWGRC